MQQSQSWPSSMDAENSENTFENEYKEMCSICCEEKTRSNINKDSIRPKQICYDCWSKHIKHYVEREYYRVGEAVISPFNQGSGIDIVDCINSLNNEEATEIEEMLYKKYCTFSFEIGKCPSEVCDFVYVADKCKWGSNENVNNCPKCQMPLIANSSFSFKSIMASFYLIMANKCPKCDIPIQKISGCPHMTCPCGHQFCWYCYRDHPSGVLKRVYPLHTIPECAFIFISKIVLFLICLVSLLVTFSGNSAIRYLFSIMSDIFSVLWRAIVLDGFILIQVLVVLMKNRKKSPYRSPNQIRSSALKQIGFHVLINAIGFCLLGFINQLQFFLIILMGQFIVAVLGFFTVYVFIFSLETWFEFVA